MKIRSVEPVVVRVGEDNRNALLRGGWVFLRVHTDEGIPGLGEASHGDDDRLVLAIAAMMAERIVGGRLALPDGPGLGHVLDERTVAAHSGG